MATMPLLTPSESYQFQSALIDYSDGLASPEWSMYTRGLDDEYDKAEALPPRKGTEKLAKATKDLMSLDTVPLKRGDPADRDIMSMTLPGATFALHPPFKSLVAPVHPHPQTYALLHSLPRFSSPSSTLARPLAQLEKLPLTVAPGLTLDSSAASDSQQSTSSGSTDPSPPPRTPPTLKRPYPSSSDTGPSTSAAAAAPPATATRPQAKKARASPPHQTGPVLSAKPMLLTPSQKKANHIQSEQKRRANIRRGYETLCDTVPALREAIRAEEAQEADEEGGLRAKSKRKGRGKKGASENGEKTDGRAGPRSENVVLQKTIDYVNGLLSERTMLLERLNRARSRLAPGHPALSPRTNGAVPLWERKWTGGLGVLDDGADAGDGDSDDDDES